MKLETLNMMIWHWINSVIQARCDILSLTEAPRSRTLVRKPGEQERDFTSSRRIYPELDSIGFNFNCCFLSWNQFRMSSFLTSLKHHCESSQVKANSQAFDWIFEIHSLKLLAATFPSTLTLPESIWAEWCTSHSCFLVWWGWVK